MDVSFCRAFAQCVCVSLQRTTRFVLCLPSVLDSTYYYMCACTCMPAFVFDTGPTLSQFLFQHKKYTEYRMGVKNTAIIIYHLSLSPELCPWTYLHIYVQVILASNY